MSTLLLVPTSGEKAAEEIASYVLKVATSLNADIEVLHILRNGETEDDGKKCATVFKKAASKTVINVRTTLATGNLVEAIVAAGENHHADLIVMGASRGQVVEEWLSADVMDRCDVPVLVIPHCYRDSSKMSQ